MIWGIAIVLYLFLAGLGAGAYAVTVLIAHRTPDAPKTLRAGRILVPAVVGVGLILLMVDARAGMLNPLRFLYLVSNASSVMSWGVVILSAFMVVSLAGLVLDLAKRRVPVWLEAVGLAAALATAAYTGVLLGVVETFPLWHTPILPVLFVVSAAGTGIAAVALVGTCVADERRGVRQMLARTRIALPAVELVLVLLLLTTTQGGPVGDATVQSLLAGRYATVFWVGLVTVGLAFPLAANVADLRRGNGVPGGLMVVAELGVLVGGFLLRYLVVCAALPLS